MNTLFAAMLLTSGSIVPPVAAGSAPADSAAPVRSSALRADLMEPPPKPHLFGRKDLYFLGATAAGFTLAAFNDEWLTHEAIGNQGNETRRKIADLFQNLPVVSVSTAAGLYAYGRWGGHPVLARRAGRVAVSIGAAAGATVGLKAVFGRYRPLESPDDPFRFDPFSGHRSLPSGHTALTFAAAVAVDRETTSGWIPWLVYPAASVVAWSRVHDLEHWASDVVAGAAIGGWTAWKTGSLLEGRSMGVPGEPRMSLLLLPRDGAVELVVARRF